MGAAIVSGRLVEVGPGYIVIGGDLRIEVPADVSLADCQVGSWYTVTLTRDRDRIIAQRITRNEGS